MTFERVMSIHGVPRSGTSWLGQILNSHSDVAYRFQPLYAYRFRGRLSTASTDGEVRAFLDDLYNTRDDDFIAGRWPIPEVSGPAEGTCRKRPNPSLMVIKEVRYHYLIEKLLLSVPDLKIIGIVRNPCAVINSWAHNPKEFDTGWDIWKEWRTAPSKNQGRPEEYFGFEKWRELTSLFLDLHLRFPKRFLLVQYERLVSSPTETVDGIFSFSGLHLEAQVLHFIRASQAHHVDDAYAVYKSPTVKDRWRHELEPRIADAIFAELKSTPLERFLA